MTSHSDNPLKIIGHCGEGETINALAQQSADKGITEARKHLCQAANLYNLCVKCVNSMIADELPEVARTSEQFQAAVGTLFIESSRAGFVQKMPTKPIKHE